jgi:CDP-2,3-bis-(O-geranylgeranyl)-sn-glycerol synthase
VTTARAATNRTPLGLFFLALLALALLLRLPQVITILVASRLLIARIYTASLAAYLVHQRVQGRLRPLPATILVSALPVALILITSTLVGTLAGLPRMQLQQMTATAFIICTFNLGAVLFAGATPLDGGLTLGGSRLLGAGKTVRGAAGGLLVATMIGLTASVTLSVALLVASCAMAGDLLGSFVKRRLGRERGAPLLLLDQLDALLPVTLVEWRWHVLDLSLLALAALAVSVFLIQLAGNYLLYRMGKKAVPW